jgi:hypothetical protein
MVRTILVVTLVAFLGLTGVALYHHGYTSIFTNQLETYGGIQVLVDLIIASTIFIVWMWKDAKANGRNPLIWVILIAMSASIAMLLYLILYKSRSKTKD